MQSSYQIDSLSVNEMYGEDYHVLVKPIYRLTMIDGKICTELSNVSSSQSSYIHTCGAKVSDMYKPLVIS